MESFPILNVMSMKMKLGKLRNPFPLFFFCQRPHVLFMNHGQVICKGEEEPTVEGVEWDDAVCLVRELANSGERQSRIQES